MIKIGKYNTLKVVKELDFGLYLDGEERGEILLPRRYVPDGCQPGDELEVFIYFDSENRIIATTARPYAEVGTFSMLKVRSVDRFGAFLDWGIMKDVLVPFREQKVTMEEDQYYLVYVYFDDISKRIVASAKLDKFLNNVIPEYEPNQEVDIIVENKTDLGYKVIINNLHWGMIYDNEIFQSVRKGDKLKAYIKQVREDEKIDVVLQPLGYEKTDVFSSEILNSLRQNNGFLPFSDKSSAEDIMKQFSCSKKNFKKAIGLLYKQKLITISDNGIKLNE